MAQIQYTHTQNLHTVEGPQAALPMVLELIPARSLLDVGCGTGVWLKAALDLGLTDIFGVDGVPIPASSLKFPERCFKVQDFTESWNLGRKFDLALCLEVAEHLPQESSGVLVDSLVAHADTIVFSAACPGQDGQNHINGQWPVFWQKLFNERGFVCSDEFRLKIWDDTRIEVWYRQNMFVARRAQAGLAGTEPRLPSMVHPDLLEGIIGVRVKEQMIRVRKGKMPLMWYLKLPVAILRGWILGR